MYCRLLGVSYLFKSPCVRAASVINLTRCCGSAGVARTFPQGHRLQASCAACCSVLC